MTTPSIKKAIKKLEQLGGVTEHLDSVVSYRHTCFQTVAGGEYSFLTNIYDDGGASLSARRVGFEQGEYFWGNSYEASAYNNAAELLDTLVQDVLVVLHNRTRIRQIRKLFVYSFSCEVHQGGAWRCLGQHEAFRFGGFRFPPARQKVTEYACPALLSSGKST